MSPDHRVRSLVFALVAALLGFLLGSLLRFDTQTPDRYDATLDDQASGDLQEILSDLEEIKRRLESQDAPPVVRSPAGGEANELVARLDQLMNEVSALRELVSRLTLDVLIPPRARPKDPVAINDLVVRIRQDSGVARQEHFGWSPNATYGKYGCPDAVSTLGSRRTVWRYEVDQEYSLELIFTDDLLTSVSCPRKQ